MKDKLLQNSLFRFLLVGVGNTLLSLILMFLLVNLPNIHNGFYEFCAKVFSNIVVLVLNYVFSTLFVFRKGKEDK